MRFSQGSLSSNKRALPFACVCATLRFCQSLFKSTHTHACAWAHTLTHTVRGVEEQQRALVKKWLTRIHCCMMWRCHVCDDSADECVNAETRQRFCVYAIHYVWETNSILSCQLKLNICWFCDEPCARIASALLFSLFLARAFSISFTRSLRHRTAVVVAFFAAVAVIAAASTLLLLVALLLLAFGRFFHLYSFTCSECSSVLIFLACGI